MFTVTTGIIFLLFTRKHIWVWAIYEGGPRVRRLPMKWSKIAESLSNTAYRNKQPTFPNYIGHSGFMLNVRPFNLLDFYLFSLCFVKLGEPGSSGSIVSGYGLVDRAIGVRSPAGAKDFSSSLCVQTGSGAHPASCTISTGVVSPGVKRGRGVTLTTHPHLVPRS
jgi:hypothetical protein